MDLGFNLSMSQEQKLIMTQQMQLSIKILQLSSYELTKLIEKQVQENPLLEINNEDIKKEEDSHEDIDEILKYKNIIKNLKEDNYNCVNNQESEEEVNQFNFISTKKSLKEYLLEQIMYLDVKEYIKCICNYIIEDIDEKGYLGEDIEVIAKELKVSIELANKALNIVQGLEPDGIGARNLSECLKIQCNKKGIEDEKIYNIIDNYLEDIAENKYSNIGKKLDISPKKAQMYGDFIKSLQPKPSSGFYTGEDVKYIVPDAYIKKIGEEYIILMNESMTPKLTINNLYKNIINSNEDETAVEYVKEKLDSASYLIKSIEQRKSTIYKVLEKIVEKQKEYFDKGKKYLKPMTLKEIAEQLDVHESTVSRAIKEKYVYTNNGIIKIKDLFTTAIESKCNEDAISNVTVKNMIEKLIEEEDKKKPLSDQNIADKLKKSGVNISRRTVAKYREEMGIKSSMRRKRY
ncbi:RNA polymerase factor sigma-54 [Clostridium cochlearium]|uniref:RNA polymerase, sigma 54 subunit, RpoN/SigL n=1 Tax=Clostridium cochlearium TaxID=1494 RepID=A0ABY0QNE7_CLOCO|nr:RNA polymerase factor sigma-54 [Clostridium cochlearium]MBE6065767.1 RNA polymerase factor sigma-54 [Clostridium cochlearium]MDU1442585.1 RNA polymerase factor sigma-54 [Clostridium cochlearium]NMA57155.1 RNA polymerase factor sigma-54 [Clostridium cochlearium]NME95864.1 RNA polymerase factor sigma-54 [Clostridium cochlearium]SDL36522.1 RNA polymerase, sigma 54 subunit, RpoN/SigL [Clostridium cochlearium]